MVIILLLIGLVSAQYCPYCMYDACSEVSYSIYNCSACNSGYGLIPVQIPEPLSGPAAGAMGPLYLGMCQPCPLYCSACEYAIFLPANYHGMNALNCTDCAAGYVNNPNNGTCYPCPVNCLTCTFTNISPSCTICSTGYALSGTQCVATTTTAQGQITGASSGDNKGEIIGLSIWGTIMSIAASNNFAI